MGDSKFEPFPPIYRAGRVTIPPRRYSSKFEPFLRPYEQTMLGAEDAACDMTRFRICRASAFCTRHSKNRQIRGYEKNAGKRAGIKMPPSPSTASGKARRNRTFVHIEKGVKMMQ